MIQENSNYQGLAPGKVDSYQVGVFAFTENEELVLVTTRNKGSDWILPKGNTEKDRSDRDQAREEAYEEAGLKGEMRWKYFEFDTHGKIKKLRVYAMKLEKMLEDYPEKNERRRILISFDEAERMVGDDLTAVIQSMRREVS